MLCGPCLHPWLFLVVDFVGQVGQWSGTATDLLHELEAQADEKTKHLKSWPATARILGAAVKRLAPNLREAGLGVELSRTGRSRIITLTRMDRDFDVTNVTNVIAPEKQGFESDAGVTQNGCGDASDGSSVTSETSVNPEENGHCDSGDVNDAKIPAHSIDSDWNEL